MEVQAQERRKVDVQTDYQVEVYVQTDVGGVEIEVEQAAYQEVFCNVVDEKAVCDVTTEPPEGVELN